MGRTLTPAEWEHMREDDYAPSPVDGRVELKYRLLALTVYGVGLALGLSIVVGALLAAAWAIGG